MRKMIYKSDVEIRYACGCSESRLEYPEYWEHKCPIHKKEHVYTENVTQTEGVSYETI